MPLLTGKRDGLVEALVSSGTLQKAATSKVKGIEKRIERMRVWNAHQRGCPLAVTRLVLGELTEVSIITTRPHRQFAQAVGRNALHLLEDLTGQYNYNLGAMQAGGQDGEPQDFDGFFALYGECARL
eukprot:1159224-Pelagomonas_calceolata.AAC.6